MPPLQKKTYSRGKPAEMAPKSRVVERRVIGSVDLSIPPALAGLVTRRFEQKSPLVVHGYSINQASKARRCRTRGNTIDYIQNLNTGVVCGI